MQDKAIQAVEEARSENPTDVDLILTEANINFRLGNNERYSELISEALKQDSSNATLYYNLGVVSTELGEKKDAFIDELITDYERLRLQHEKHLKAKKLISVADARANALRLNFNSETIQEPKNLGVTIVDNVSLAELIPSAALLHAPKINNIPISAVASDKTSGVFVTTMPLFFAASKSIFPNPTAKFEIIFTLSGNLSIVSLSILSVNEVRTASQPWLISITLD